MKTLMYFFLSTVVTFAQSSLGNQVRTSLTLEKLGSASGNDAIYGAAYRPISLEVGDVMLTPYSNKSTLELIDRKKFENVLTQYNIKTRMLRIRSGSLDFQLPIERLRSIAWIDSATLRAHYFINTTSFVSDNSTLIALMEILNEGEFTLLKEVRTQEQKPTYVTALDAGSRNTIIKRKVYYYCLYRNELTLLDRKKDLLSLQESESKKIEEYIRVNHVSIGDETELMDFFNYLNNLGK